MDRDHLFRTCREHVGHNGIPRCVITVSTRTVHCTHTYSACSGTAIYVYLILSNAPLSTSFVSNVICDFRLDGTIVGHFRHDTDGTNIFQYNVLAFSQEQLLVRNRGQSKQCGCGGNQLPVRACSVGTRNIDCPSGLASFAS